MKRIPSLEALGLTRLEALAYTYLVANPGTTGYGVSRGIGKPTANVYRALESLERKGAVRNDRASPPLYRAVPPGELFDQLEREFMDRREIAARALAALAVQPDADDDGMFALTTAEQVMGRLRILLTAARRFALVDGAPEILESLEDAVGDARARGTRVVILARGAARVPHGDTFEDRSAGGERPGALRAVADAREALIARLSPDGGARDALWTRSALFARTLHDAVANDVFYVLVEQGLREGLSVEELEGAFDGCRALRALARD